VKTVTTATIITIQLMILWTISRKGIGLIFPNSDTEGVTSVTNAVTQSNSETSAAALGRVVFSL
jgi:hypothetical protein